MRELIAQAEALSSVIDSVGNCPILYSDTIRSRRVNRDDLWAITTEQLLYLRQLVGLFRAQAEQPASDWQHLKPFGYAPGGYMNECQACKTIVHDLDKRAITCRPCAEKAFAAAEQPAEPKPGWYCPTCRKTVPGVEVTYHEYHEVCNTKVADTPVEQPAEPQSEPVLVVQKEPDYHSRGHYYEGKKSWIDPFKIYALPIGTKLYAHPDPRIAEYRALLREAKEVLWDFDIHRELHDRIAAALKEG